MRTALAISFLLVAACKGGEGPGEATPDAAEILGDAGPELPGDGLIGCPSDDSTIPIYKVCESDLDCEIVLHQINCCGTELAIGLAESGVEGFATPEASCRQSFPDCGCASSPTTAEDGRSETEGEIEVRCAMNACRTYVP